MLPVPGLSTDASDHRVLPEATRTETPGRRGSVCVCVRQTDAAGKGGYLALRPCEEKPTKQELAKAKGSEVQTRITSGTTMEP